MIWLTAGATVILAPLVALFWGTAQATGLLVGSAVMLVNFAGLDWGVSRAMRSLGRDPLPDGRPSHRYLWLATTGTRLLLAALAVGALAASGAVGSGGLVGSLVILPAMVVVAGLRESRIV